jgi:zinc protease
MRAVIDLCNFNGLHVTEGVDTCIHAFSRAPMNGDRGAKSLAGPAAGPGDGRSANVRERSPTADGRPEQDVPACYQARVSRRIVPWCICAGLLASGPLGWAAPPHDAKTHKPAAGQKSPKGPVKKTKPTKGKGSKGADAQPASPAPRAAPAAPAERVSLTLDVHRATLANGLRVVVNVDHTSPTVAVAVVYDVGARDEERGRSGFAHLFEHMMFQGSANVAKGDHFKLVAGHGGELNGTTNGDRTSYYEVLPENELALGLWLEADRMRSLDVSQANLENQRKVGQEEYRMRVSNAAYQPARLRRDELVYQGYWPYEHPAIGSMADLDAAELGWVKAFHAAHYGPNQAVLAIAGDVDADAAVALARRYFEEIPRVAAPAFADAPVPEQTSQRTAHVKDDHARTTAVLLGWAVPATGTPDHDALEIAADILGGGESSRLHQILVKDRGFAQKVSAGTQRRRGPDVFQIDAITSSTASGKKAAEVEKLIEAEIQALATRGPSDAELEKARSRAEAAFVLDLQSSLSRARRLAEHEIAFGDAGTLPQQLERLLAVSKEDVKRAVAQHLGPTRRTIVEAEPADAPSPEPEAQPAHAAHAAKLAGPATPAKSGAKAGDKADKKGGKPAKKAKKP